MEKPIGGKTILKNRFWKTDFRNNRLIEFGKKTKTIWEKTSVNQPIVEKSILENQIWEKRFGEKTELGKTDFGKTYV